MIILDINFVSSHVIMSLTFLSVLSPRAFSRVRFHSKQTGPTTLNMLGPDRERKIVYINRYSTKGFTINGIRVFGSVALLPKAILQWKISSREELTPEAFSLFYLHEPRIGKCMSTRVSNNLIPCF